MKAGIVTLYGYFNYGNRLQNYALQEALKKLNVDVDTIIISSNENAIKRYLKKYYVREKGKIKVKRLRDLRREKNINIFSKKYIKVRKFKQLNLQDKTLNSIYDKFFVGSDQVWNPTFWSNNINSIDFKKFLLTFADNRKRYSYASSFGIRELPEFWKKPFKSELKKFNLISVREEAGAKIVKDEINKSVPVVLDPTLLLTKEEWEQRLGLASKKENYILVFFLGNVDREYEEYIDSVCKGKRIINLMDSKVSKYYCSDPRDFLNFIKNASGVLTDSFHASVFSILFKVPFIVFDRKTSNNTNMNSRIETLLSKFSLQDRIYNGNEIDLFNCNFKNVDNVLEKERKKSMDYLKECIDWEGEYNDKKEN